MQKRRLFPKIMVLALLFALWPAGTRAEEEKSGWSEAEQEVMEAGGAVKEATRETTRDVWEKARESSLQIYYRTREIWDETRAHTGETWGSVQEESRRVWEKVMEESREAVGETKARIHEATAPQPPPPKEPAPE